LFHRLRPLLRLPSIQPEVLAQEAIDVGRQAQAVAVPEIWKGKPIAGF
jgi:hypothetical protein